MPVKGIPWPILKRKPKQNRRVSKDLPPIKTSRTTRRGLGGFVSKRSQSERKGSDIRLQRAQRQRWQRLGRVRDRLLGYRRIIIGGIFILLIIALMSVAVYVLNQSSTFILDKITVTGNREIASTEISDKISYLQGQSLFFFSASSVEQALLRDFPLLKDVQVRKLLPSELEITVVERVPKIAYVNLSGIYLVDEEGIVAYVLRSDQVVALTAEEELILSGYGDPEATYTYERYLTGIDSIDERQQVVWEEVPREEKESALNSKRQDLITYVESKIANFRDELGASRFAGLTRVEGFHTETFVVSSGAGQADQVNTRYRMYKVGDEFDSTVFEMSQQVIDFLLDNELEIDRLRWESEFTLNVRLTLGIEILFSSTRNLNAQLVALQTIRQQGDLSGVQVVDLRSELIAVR